MNSAKYSTKWKQYYLSEMLGVKSLCQYKNQSAIKLILLNCKTPIQEPKRFFSSNSVKKPKLRNDANKISPIGWFLLAIPATTFGLGCWQVKRKAWKENLIQELDKKTKSDPIELPNNLEEVESLEYRPVKVRGRFLHEKELYLGPRSFIHPYGAESRSGIFSPRDDSIGYHVITPFKLAGSEETILVNRGWIPKIYKKPTTRLSGQVGCEVELVGIVRTNENRPQFSPEGKGDVYLYRDLQKMCSETGALPVFIDANYESSIPGGPVGGQTRVTLRNEHLSYIFTWYSLSAATAFMWYRQIFKRKGF